MFFSKTRKLERLPLDLADRVNLLLVYAGEKPATTLDFCLSKDGEPFIQYDLEPHQRIKKAEKILSSLKLPYQQGDIITLGGYAKIELISLHIAQEQKLIDLLITARLDLDHFEIGRLYGFPKTSTEAFLGIRERNYSTRLRDGNPAGYFTPFVFSEDNCQEEFRTTSLRWHDTIKRIAPRVYEEIRKSEKRLKRY